MATSHNFSGKVVIITGSSSGIGEEAAIHLASLGAQVVITGTNATRIASVAQKCEAASPLNHKPLEITCDITREDECKRLVAETIARFAKIDVLVNNAGISKICGIDDPNIAASYDAVHATNVRPVIVLCHEALPHLVQSKGCIVNVSSCAALRPYVGGIAYCSSKSALDMVARCMALELGPKGVRVNNVNPAIIRTPIFEAQGRSREEVDTIMQVVNECYPLGRPGTPSDVAKAIAYLASSDASFVSGTTLVVDGASIDCSSTHTPKRFVELMSQK